VRPQQVGLVALGVRAAAGASISIDTDTDAGPEAALGGGDYLAVQLRMRRVTTVTGFGTDWPPTRSVLRAFQLRTTVSGASDVMAGLMAGSPVVNGSTFAGVKPPVSMY
jgi:hypothetical protein